MLRKISRRQIFLDQHYYRENEEQETALLANVRVLLLTPAKLAEIRNGDSEWSFLFTGEQKWGLLVDEYQRCFWKLAIAMGIGSIFMVLTGDVDQGRDPRGSRTASADAAAQSNKSRNKE